MNKIHINIIDSYWKSTENDFCESGKEHRLSTDIETSLEIEDFKKLLINLIMDSKNDGIEVEICSIKDNCFIDILLLLSEDYKFEKYNIEYIVDFLNKFIKIDKNIDINTDIKFNNFIYISRSNLNIDQISEILVDEGLEFEFVSQTNHIYERGASDFWEGYLIGIAQNATWDAIKLSYSKIKNKFSNLKTTMNVSCLSVENLRKNVAEISMSDINNLILISFLKINNNDDLYQATFRTYYEKIIVTAKSDGEIQSFERIDLSKSS